MAVALLARAWIEMARRENNWLLGFVALLARAWIEIATKRIYMVRVYVALLARAWIEMSCINSPFKAGNGRSPCESVD